MQLTEKIRQTLFKAILEGEFTPGGHFPTEQQSMERFGASRITVRRAYALLEAANIIVRQRKLGTIVNADFGAARGTLGTLGVIVPLGSAFSRDFLETVCAEAAAHDVLTVLEPTGAGGVAQSEAAFRLAAHGIRDIVVWGMDRSLDSELFLRMRVLGVNLVFFDRIKPGNFADYVALDNRAAIACLVQVAVADGARRIFFVDTTGLAIDSNAERHAFCQEECARRALTFADRLPERFPTHSAVLAVNDAEALRVAGCGVPVYSIDGTTEALAAGIVSYRQPMKKMAEACLHVLQEQRRRGKKWQAGDYRFCGELVRL